MRKCESKFQHTFLATQDCEQLKMKLVTIESPRMAAVVEKAVDERYFYKHICYPIINELLRIYLGIQKLKIKYKIHSDIEGQ